MLPPSHPEVDPDEDVPAQQARLRKMREVMTDRQRYTEIA